MKISVSGYPSPHGGAETAPGLCPGLVLVRNKYTPPGGSVGTPFTQ